MKKIFAPLTVVALVAVMAVSLLGQQRRAEAGAITAVNFQAPVQATGLTETWTVSFTTAVTVPATTGTITIDFPQNFTTTNVTAANITLSWGGTPTVVSTTNGRLVITNGATASGAAAVSVTVANVTNPTTNTALTGAAAPTATAGFSVTTSVDTVDFDATPPQIWNTAATKSPTTSVPADGASTVLVTFTPSSTSLNAGTGVNVITATTDIGAFSSTPTGTLAAAWTAITTPVTTATGSLTAGTAAGNTGVFTVKAPSTAGTATVVLRATPASGGAAVVIGTTQITFTTATALPGAAASVTVVPAAASIGNTTAQNTVITALDATGTQVLNGTVVTVTTSNGTFTTCPGGTTGSGVCTTSIQANGAVTVGITGSGVSGTQTITATVGSVTGTGTVTLTGTTAGSVSVAVRAANPTSGAASTTSGATTPARCGAYVAVTCYQNIASATVKDAAGNNAAGIVVTWTVAPADGIVSFVTPQTDTAITSSVSSAVSTILGQARAGIKVATTGVAGTVYTITATAPTSTGTTNGTVTITLGDTFSSSVAASTMTITAPDMAVASAGTITVDVLGAAGKPVGDGTSVQLVTSAGAVANVANGLPTGPNPAFTVNGKATFTYVSPSTADTINATALIGSSAKSATFKVGAGSVTPPPAGTGFSGGTIAPAGVSIVSFTGTTAQLTTAGTTAKVVSVTATVGGKMITFVIGAPDFVNAEFNAAFPTGLNGTLVIVKTGA
ncbi:MAG: hypothetical protein EPO65_01035 [Dehalococcoidia bacterium]|nr:MAG: hypothetical protein EPO65_01035 [Dehalococcoidia bacterium]